MIRQKASARSSPLLDKIENDKSIEKDVASRSPCYSLEGQTLRPMEACG